jgi:hypothetical protein
MRYHTIIFKNPVVLMYHINTFSSTMQLIITALYGMYSATILANWRHLMMAVSGRNMLREGKGTIISCIIDGNILPMRSHSQYRDGLLAGRPGWIPGIANYSFLHSVQIETGAHTTSCPMVKRGGAIFPVVKRPKRDAERSPLYSAEFKNGGAISLIHHMSSWRST